MLASKIKEKYISKHKKTAPLFLFLEGQMYFIFMLQICWNNI